MKKAAAIAGMIIRRSFLLSVAAYLSLGAACAKDKPRAVSLDYCADQYILALAERDQIAALTREAIASHSFYRRRAAGIPTFGASAEEILVINPDITIRSWGGFAMLPLLARAHIAVAATRYGTGSDILYDNIRAIGAALEQSDRATEIIRDHQYRLSHLAQKVAENRAKNPGRRLRAAYIAPGGITAGKDTFVHEIITLAGLTSISGELGLTGWQPLPLEALIQNPPDIIIGSFFDLDNLHVSHWSLTRHSRIKQMLDRIPTIMVPGRYLSCNGIFTIDAAEYIHDRLEELVQ